MWKNLKDLLPRAVREAGLETQLTAQRVIETATKVFGARWNGLGAKYLTVVSFKEGTLSVQVRAPAVAQMIQVERVALMNDLNAALGRRAVSEIKVQTHGF